MKRVSHRRFRRAGSAITSRRKPRPLGTSLARFASALAICGAMAASVGSAQAATVIWDVNAGAADAQDGGGNWTVGGSTFWNPITLTNVATADSLTTDIARFGNGGVLASPATVNVSSQSINGLIFGATLGSGYSLTNSAPSVLTLGGNGIVVNAGAQNTAVGDATNLSLTLGAAQTWTNGSASALNFAGNIANSTFVLTLGATSAGAINLTGNITGGTSGGVTVNSTGSGIVTLSGTNTQTGTTTLTAGILRATTSVQALGTGASTLQLNGGTLQLTNGLNYARNTNVGTGTTVSNVTIQADNTAAGAGTTTSLGTLTFNNAASVLNITAGALANSGSAGVTFNGTTTLANSGNVINTNNSLFNSAVTTTTTLSGNVAGNFNATFGGTGTTTITGLMTGTGALTLTKNGTGTLNINGVGNSPGTGTITINGGTVAIGSGGTLASRALTFGATNTGGSTFNFNAAATAANQGLGALSFLGGDGVVQSTYGTASGNASITFSSLAARTSGASGLFIASGGANGSTNKIVLTGVATNTVIGTAAAGAGAGAVYFFNTVNPPTTATPSDFAVYDTGGFVRAIDYTADTTLGSTVAASGVLTGSRVNQITATSGSSGTVTQTAIATVNGIKFSTGTTTLATSSFQVTTPSLLVAGGGTATISSASATTGGITSGAGDLIVRTDAVTDVLTINAPIAGVSLTKTGAGTLIVGSGTNTFTGAIYVNGGTYAFNTSYNNIDTNTSLGPTGGKNIYLNGGTLKNNSATTFNPQTTTKVLNIQLAGGTLDINGQAAAFDDAGQVTGPGNWTITNSSATGNVVTLGSSGGSNSGFTGNLFMNAVNSTLRIANANGAGNAGQTIVMANNTTALDIQAFVVNNVVVGGTGISGAGAIVSASTGGGITGTVNLTANTQISNANTLTLSGTITDNGNNFGITKTSTGILALTGANTFNGGVTLSASSLQLGNNSALGTGNLTISTTNLTVSATDATARVLTNGVILQGANTNFGGGANSGALTLGALNLGGAARTITVNNPAANAITFGGPVTNGTDLTLLGTGTLALAGAGTFTGITTVNAGGTLSVGAGTLAATSAITVGTTTTSGLNFLADGVGAAVNLASGTSVTLGGATTSAQLGFQLGNLSGYDSFNLSGASTLTVNPGGAVISITPLLGFGANTYNLISAPLITGFSNVTLNTGSLPTGFGYQLNTSSTLISLGVTAAGANFFWTGDNGTSWNAGAPTYANTNFSTDISGSPDALSTPGTASTVTFSAQTITGSTPVTSTLDQNFSILGLATNNSSTGNITINQGTFGTLTIGTGGITINPIGGGAATTAINAPIILGATQVWTATEAGQTLAVQSGLSAPPVNGSVSGAFGIILAGAGKVTLGGFNTFSGGLTMGASQLNINNGGSTTTNSALGTGPVTFAASPNLLDNTSGAPQSVLTTGAQSWNGDITFTGTSSLNLGTGAVTPSASRVVTVNGNTLQVGGIIGGGAISITKAGPGTLTLGGANAFTGGFILNAGTVNVNAPLALGATTGTVQLNGGTLDNTSGVAVVGTTAGALTLGADVSFGSSAAGASGALTLPGAITLTSDRTITANAPGLSIGGANALNFSGVISGNFQLTKLGKGILILGNTANTFGGAGKLITLSEGTLSIGPNGGLGNTGNVLTINASPGAAVAIDASAGSTPAQTNVTVSSDFAYIGSNALRFISANVALGGANRTITVMSATNHLTFNAFSGPAGSALTANGIGFLDLEGTSTYTGPTTVNPGITLTLGNANGTASANGSLASTTLVLNGGTFKYTRTGTNTQAFTSGVTIGSGAASMTTSLTTQTLTLNGLTRNAGGTIDFAPLTGSTVTTTAINSGTTGILGGWATVASGANWAVGSTAGAATNITAYAAYTPSVAVTTAPGSGTNVDFQVNNSTAWTTQSINSLRFNQAATTSLTLTIAPTNTLTVDSGGILVTPTSTTGSSTITGGTIATTGDLIISQFNTTGNLVLNSSITAAGLTKSGAATGATIIGGTGALAGTITNALTGAVTVNAGVLQVNSSSASGGNGATGALNSQAIVLNGGALALNFDGDGTGTANSINLTDNVTVNGNASITVQRLGAGNPISATPTLFTTPLNKTLQLGTLSFGNAGRTLTVTPGNAYGLEFTGTTTLNQNLTTINVGTVTASNVVQGLTLTGKVTGTIASGIWNKNGVGTLVLNNATNDFTSNILLQGGVLAFNSDAALGNAANSITFTGLTGATTLRAFGGADSVVVTSSDTGSKAVTVANPARLFVGSSLLGSVITAINGSSVTLADNANQTIAAAATVINPLSISTGRTINLWGSTVANNVIEAAENTTLTLTSPFGPNNGPLTKTNLGTLVLAADNGLWAGQLSISTGAVRVTNGGALGISTSASAGNTVVTGSGAGLQLAGVSTWEQINLTGSGLNQAGALEAFTNTTNTTNGLITLAGAANIGADAGATLNIRGGITGAQALTFVGPGTINVDTTSLGAPASLAKLNSGTTTISTANPLFVGTISISSGTLAFGGTAGGAGSVGGNGAITIFPGGILAVNDSMGLPVANRLGSGRTVDLQGGTINYFGNASGASSETLAALTLTRAGASISVTADPAQPANLIFTSLTRSATSAQATVLFSGSNLGNAPGPGVGTISFTTLPTFVGGTGSTGTTNKALLPYALAKDTVSGAVGFATTDPGGPIFSIRRLSASEQSASQIAGVNFTLASSPTIYGALSVNSLNLASSAGLTVSPMQTFTVASGGLLANGTNTLSGGILTAVANDLIIHALGDITINSAITGTAGLTKTGTGILTLGSASYYTGNTNINQGTLKLGVSNAIMPGSAIALNAGGTLDLNGKALTTGVMFGQVGAQGTGGNVMGTASTSTLVLNQDTGARSLEGVMSGGMSFARSGGNNTVVALTMSGNNTYTGATLINGNTVTLIDAGRLSGTTSLDINYAGLNITDSGTVAHADRVNDAATVTMRGGFILYTGRDNYNSTENFGLLNLAQGSNRINITNGGGTLRSTEVSFGTVTPSNGATLLIETVTGQIGTASRLYFANGVSLAAANNGIIPWATFGAADLVGYNPSFGAGALNATGFQGYDVTLSSGPATLGAGSLSQNMRLSAGSYTVPDVAGVGTAGTYNANGIAFATTVNAQGISFADPLDKLNLTSGALVVSGNFTSTIGSGVGNGILTSGGTSATASDLYLSKQGGTAVLTVNSSIQDSGVVGATTRLVVSLFNNTGVTLLGSNTYSGGTIVNGANVFTGTLTLSTAGADGSTIYSIPGNLTINGASVVLTAQGQIKSTGVLSINGAGRDGTTGRSTVTLVGANTLAGVNFDNNGGGATSAPTLDVGSGIFTLNGNLNASSSNVASTATILGTGSMDLGGASRIFTVNPIRFNSQNVAPDQPSLSISSIISGTGGNFGITKQGDGLLQLGGANNFTGGIDLQFGGLIIANAAAIGTGGTLNIGNNTTITADNTARAVTNPVTINGDFTLGVRGSIAPTSNGATVPAALTLSGPIGFGSGVTRTITSNSGPTVVNIISGPITGSGTLIKDGIGFLVLSNVNNATSFDTSGSQAIQVKGGTLEIQGATGNAFEALGTTPSTTQSDNIVLNGGVLSLNLTSSTGTLDSRRGMLLGAPVGSGVGTISVANGKTYTYGGTIADNGTGPDAFDAFVKTGPGTLTLSGVNTFTGDLAVGAGTLNFTNATAPTPGGLSVAGGATLNLLNGVGQTINLGSGLINLGAGTGTAILGLELLNTGAYDHYTTTGAALTANTVQFNLTALPGFVAGTYDLLTVGSGLNSATYVPNLVGAAGFGFSLTTSDTRIRLVATALPGDVFWKGGVTGSPLSWAGLNATNLDTNFSTDLIGTNAKGLPGISQGVTFSANGLTGTTLATTMDGAFSIRDLTFNNNNATVTTITIAPGTGGALTLTPTATTAGINVQTGAPATITISAPVTLGASQTWTVADAATVLSSSGGIGGASGINLIKEGSGILQLSGTNTYLGTTTVTNGVLRAGAASGLSPNSAYTIGATGTLRMNGFNAAIGSLAGPVGAIVENGTATAATLTAGGDNSSTTFAGTIQNGSTATMGLTKVGSGALTLSGTNTYTGNTTVNTTAGNTSTLNITGSVTGNTTTSALNYGNTAGNTIVNISGNLTAFVTTGANIAGSVSVMNQTAGTVTIVPTNGADTQWVAKTGYGYLNITGGTFNTGRFDVNATNAAASVGVAYVGGTGTLNQNVGDYLIIGYNGVGALTVGPGGTLTRSAAVTNTFNITMNAANTYGVFNMAGGSADIGNTKALQFGFGASNNNSRGFVNLAGGTLSLGVNASNNYTSGTGNNAYFNYAGGTLRATGALSTVVPATSAFLTVASTMFGPIDNSAVPTAPSFTGGLTIDTNNFGVTYASPLLGATGVGVTQGDIAIPSTGNSGYIGAPAVQFSAPAGGGVPAVGYALINGSGAVTGIVITVPGVYAASETPTITLTGGGGSIAAFNTAALNVANTSGSLTKINAGTLTLNAANTYTGGTTITGGTLALGASNTLASTGNVTVNGGIFDLATFSNTVGTVSLRSGSITGTTGVLTSTNYDLRSGTASAILAGANGTSGFVKTTAGTVTLSGVNTFTGTVNANGGTLAFAADLNLGNTANPIKIDGGTLSFTGAGAVPLAAGRVVTLGAGNGTLNTSSATGVLTITGGIAGASTGNLTKTGPGTVIVPSPLDVSLNGGAGTVTVSDGTLRAGFGTGGISALTVGTTAYMDMRNSAAQVLTLGGTTGALTLNAGAQLGFELAAAGVPGTGDELIVGAGGTAVTSGNITLNFFNLAGFGAGTYNLLAAPSGLLGATYTLGAAPNGFNYTINRTDILVSLDVMAFTPIYWRGGQNLSWNTLGAATANWTSNTGGTVDSLHTPLSNETVIFSATGAPVSGNTITTTLDAGFTIDSLQFTNVPAGITAVTINAGTGGTLAVAPLSTSGGILVAAGAGNANIGAPLTASNANVPSQTWTVTDPTSTLNVSGNTTFNANVNKQGAGALTLSGTNSGSGNITLTAGTLNINSATALGSGIFTIAAGTTINSTLGATPLSTNNLQNWNGGFTFTGGANLNMGTGAVTLGATSTVTTTANTLTIGGGIDDGANTFGLAKAGAGTLVLNGNNGYDGLTDLQAGILTLGGNNSGAAGGVTMAAATTLNINNNGALGAGTFTINGGTINSTVAGVSVSPAVAQNWNGSFTFTGGNPLNLGSGTATLGASVTVTTSASTLTVGGVIAGPAAFSLTKNGTGRLTLAGLSAIAADNYAGTLILDGGITDINSAASLTGGLTMGAAAASTNLSTLNIGDNVTFGGAVVVQTNSSTTNTIAISAGKTLQLNGAVTVGTTGGTATTKLTVTGATGTLSIGTVAIPINANVQLGNATTDSNSNGATLDLSGLGTFYANLGNGTFRIGDPTNTGGGATSGSTLILAANSTITAATLRADSPDSAVTEAIKLGSGTNRFNVTTLNIGAQNGRSNGTLSFNTGTGTLTIRGLAGGAAVPDNTSRADLNVVNNVFGTGAAPTGSFDTSGHSADLRFGTMTIAGRSSNTGNATGTFTFDTGTLDANDLTVGLKTSGSTATTLTIAGTVTLNGGTSTFNAATGPIALASNASTSVGTATGTFNVGGTAAVSVAANGGNSFRLGNATAAGGTAAGSIVITGGTLTVAGDIIRGSATGTSTASLSLSGGTLDMGGKKIGGSVAASNLTSLNFASGTLQNVADINTGAGLSKTGTGTLTLDGTNAYTGVTNVTAGIVVVRSSSGLGFAGAGSGTVVSSIATLQLSNNITVGAEPLTLNGGSASGQTGALVNLSDTNTYGGLITLAADNSISALPTTTLNLTGGLLKDGKTATLTGGGAINISGVGITGPSAGSDLVIIGGTAVNVSAASNFTGPTSVSGTGTSLEISGISGSLSGTTQVDITAGGTLRLSGSGNMVRDLAPINLSNGTLVFAGTETSFTESLGALTVGASSTIDFGANNNNQFVFDSLTAATKDALLAGTFTLTISGWTGSVYSLGTTTDSGDPTQDRFVFNNNPGFNLGEVIPGISFNGTNPGMEVQLGANQYEIVAVPEPSSVALLGAAGLLGLAGYRQRRVGRGRKA